MQGLRGAVPPEIKSLVESEVWRDGLKTAGRGIARALAGVDPDLRFVFVRTDIAPELLPPGAMLGRWHVRKLGEIPYFAPICSPGGGYREPDSGVITEMQKRDARKREVAREMFERRQDELARRKKDAALLAEQRKDEIATDLRAGWRVAGSTGLQKRRWGRGG